MELQPSYQSNDDNTTYDSHSEMILLHVPSSQFSSKPPTRILPLPRYFLGQLEMVLLHVTARLFWDSEFVDSIQGTHQRYRTIGIEGCANGETWN